MPIYHTYRYYYDPNLNKKSKKSSFATWNNKEEDTYDARAASDAFQSYALRMQQKRHRHLEQKDLSRILVETKDYCRAQGTTVALQEVPLPRVRIPGAVSKCTAFYGTKEAQACASHAANYIALACDQLNRLQFVSDAVFVESCQRVEDLRKIAGEIKDFGTKMAENAVKVPTNLNMNSSHVAHFVMEY